MLQADYRRESTGVPQIRNNKQCTFNDMLYRIEIIKQFQIYFSYMSQGIVPDAMKLAKVIPIHKSKSKELFSNYRPISLLSKYAYSARESSTQ